MADGGAVSITVARTGVLIAPGASASVAFTIARAEGVSGTVTVAISGLPDNVSGSSVDIADGQTAGTLTLSAAPSATAGTTAKAILSASVAGASSVSVPLAVTVSGASGTVDTSFGTAGVALLRLSAGANYLSSIAVDSQGRTVVAGTQNGSAALARIAADGTFGTPSSLTGSSNWLVVRVRPDDSVVVGGFGLYRPLTRTA